MSWLTENPWPLTLLLGGAAVVLLILGEPRLRTAAVVCLVLAAFAYITESLIVTPGEQLETTLQQMLERFQNHDEVGVDALIADAADNLRQTARDGLAQVDLHDSFHLKDLAITVSDDGTTADAELRANGTLTIRSSQSLHFASTRWKTKWAMVDDSWKLTEVRRLNVLTGEEIGVLAAQ